MQLSMAEPPHLRRTRRGRRGLLLVVLAALLAATVGTIPTALAPAPAAASTPVYDANGPTGTIYRLYRAYFLREPDRSGYDHWLSAYRSGYPLEKISNDFARSAEFQSAYGNLDDRKFLERVYQNVMGRAPDQGGYDYWLGHMQRGMLRGSVMIYFSDSAEFRHKTAGGVPPGYATTVSVVPASSPAWDDDAPDPHVVRFGDTWYAYTTGTTWGNHIGVLVSDRPDGGWRTVTGKSYGSTALANVPSWQVPDTQWAPAVYRFAGRYALFYAAQSRRTGEWCLSVAVASGPAGPFRDSTAAPIVCQDHLGGTIDPHPFVDSDGQPWLHFKNNDGMSNNGWGNANVSKVWAVRLARDGITPQGSYLEVMAKNTEKYPWQTTLDNPQMVLRNGVHYLFHTGGDYVGNDTYATGYAVCSGPTGPCTTHAEPILRSYGDVAGPGGGTVAHGADGRWWLSYHAYTKGCYDYSCGGKRKLYVAPLQF